MHIRTYKRREQWEEEEENALENKAWAYALRNMIRGAEGKKNKIEKQR